MRTDVHTCPKCLSDNDRVTDSRTVGGQVWRRRECRRCNGRWSTFEITKEEYERLSKQISEIREHLIAVQRIAKVLG